jgi:hypothetical protein
VKGLRDPDRIFPKNQAMPKRKPLPRVIAGASLVDQLVTRCFFQEFTTAEGECYPFLPTKKGIGFSDEHAQMMGAQFEDMNNAFGKGPVVSDVSGWEKNFSEDVAECSRCPMLCTMDDSDDEDEEEIEAPHLTPKKIAFNRAFDWWKLSLLTNPCITDSGRFIYFANGLRVQRSGNFLTTTSNGIGRKCCAICVGSVASTAGDDCFEWNGLSFETLREAYKSIRLPVRDIEQLGTSRLDFCSHSFQRDADGNWKSWLFAWKRMLYECSRDSRIDPGSDLNWFKEIENHPDKEFVSTVRTFLNSRNDLLRSVAKHDQVEESLSPPSE